MRTLGPRQLAILKALEAGPADVRELATAVYQTDEPTKTQLKKTHRSVAALLRRGKIVRLHGKFSTKRYARPVDAVRIYGLTDYVIFDPDAR